MSEVKKIATRESYGKALVELGGEHSNLVVLDADLAAATKTRPAPAPCRCPDLRTSGALRCASVR